MTRWLACVCLLGIGSLGLSFSQEAKRADKTPAERGREALLTRGFNPPIWSFSAYDNAWKQWGVAEKPQDYDRTSQDRYGLHPAAYENGKLPMGLREGQGLLGKGLANDCLLCHGGSILGQSYIGLGNASLDLQALYEDLSSASGFPKATPFTFSNVRGTTEAGAMAVYLFQFRDADLNVKAPTKFAYRTDLCEDVPAWWLLKKKKTMYHTGSTNARSVRSIMQFTLTPLNSGEYIKKLEPTFADIQAYLFRIEAPKYPFPIDEKLATKGEALFTQNCVKCHGTYGGNGSYPNKIIPLKDIGTDPTRANGFSAESKKHYDETWFGQEKGPDGQPYRTNDYEGYQAPPLDGIWATAPYFHNGSVPTLYHVLNSKARPTIYTRSFRTGKEDYDPDNVGWKFTVLEKGPDPSLPALERRKVYDTTQPGRGNGGHPFGDKLTDEERKAIIEYLKRL